MSRLRAGVYGQRVGEQMILLDAEAGQYYELNGSGTLVVESWLSGRDAVAVLVERFGIDPERARTDVAALARQLAAAGLLAEEAV